ncbi:MAG: hypothetical protein H6727_16445 [Myxococcales bacterium]|nr:hypothetical protein [Myxococcales bacterium]
MILDRPLRRSTKRDWLQLEFSMVRAPEIATLLLKRYLQQPVAWTAKQKAYLEEVLRRNKKRAEDILQAVRDVDFLQMASLMQSLDASLLDELFGPLPVRYGEAIEEPVHHGNLFQSLRQEPLNGAREGVAWLFRQLEAEPDTFVKRQHLHSLLWLDIDHVNRRLLRDFHNMDADIASSFAFFMSQRHCLELLPSLLQVTVGRSKEYFSVSGDLRYYDPVLRRDLEHVLPLLETSSSLTQSQKIRLLAPYFAQEVAHPFVEKNLKLFQALAERSQKGKEIEGRLLGNLREFSLELEYMAQEMSEGSLPEAFREPLRSLISHIPPQYQRHLLPLLGDDPSKEAEEILIRFFSESANDLQYAAASGILRSLQHPSGLSRLLKLEIKNLSRVEYLSETEAPNRAAEMVVFDVEEGGDILFSGTSPPRTSPFSPSTEAVRDDGVVLLGAATQLAGALSLEGGTQAVEADGSGEDGLDASSFLEEQSPDALPSFQEETPRALWYQDDGSETDERSFDELVEELRELSSSPMPSLFDRFPGGRGAIAKWVGLHRYREALPLLQYWFHHRDANHWDVTELLLALARFGDFSIVPFLKENLPALVEPFNYVRWQANVALRAARILCPRDPSLAPLYKDIWSKIGLRKDGHWVRLVWARSFGAELSLDQCLALLFFLKYELLEAKDKVVLEETIQEMQFVLERLQPYGKILGEETCELLSEYFSSRFLFLSHAEDVQETVHRLESLFQTLHPKFRQRIEEHHDRYEETLFRDE